MNLNPPMDLIFVKDAEFEAFRAIVKEPYEQIIKVPKVLKFRDLK